MNAHLSDTIKTVRSINATAAGTTAVNGTSVDTQGFDAVRAVAAFGALTATQITKLKLQHSDDDATWSDVADSTTAALADGDGNKLAVSDLIRPTKRYVRPVVVRGTANAVVDSVVLELYKARELPVTADATVAVSAKSVDSGDA